MTRTYEVRTYGCQMNVPGMAIEDTSRRGVQPMSPLAVEARTDT